MNLFSRRTFAAFSILLATLSAILPTAHGQDVLEGIAAVVNEDVITFSQVRMIVAAKEQAAHSQYQGAALSEKIKEIRLGAVNDLIDRQLILQEFKKLQKTGAAIPDHVVEDRVDTIVREQFGGDRSAFIRTLTAEGVTLDKFKQEELDNIIVQAMRAQLVKTTTVVPEPKILEAYQQNLEQYTSEEQLHLRMIILKAGDDQRKMIDEIRQKIVAGATFDAMAKTYSEDTSTSESGGDWGWINRRTLNESLSKVAFSLKPGEVSKVLELSGQYYLLYCEAHKAQVTKSLQDMRDGIEKNLIQEERQKAQQEWLAKLRKKAFIKIF